MTTIVKPHETVAIDYLNGKISTIRTWEKEESTFLYLLDVSSTGKKYSFRFIVHSQQHALDKASDTLELFRDPVDKADIYHDGNVWSYDFKFKYWQQQ